MLVRLISKIGEHNQRAVNYIYMLDETKVTCDEWQNHSKSGY